ncbi:hypothetical protein [Stomatohabitans albus]|uniref:hypothetical protein n=1 Tax=Stomatohabitans albus TaxID=3110766 RepID=UPI00300D72BC
MAQLTINDIRALLRPNMPDLPQILAQWPAGEGPLADVPILPADSIQPTTFTELQGTVRVAGGCDDALTLGGLLETEHHAVVAAAMVITPTDLDPDEDEQAANTALAAYGSRQTDVPTEVVALLGSLEEGGPAFGVLIGRPLFLADPAGFEPGPNASASLIHAVNVAKEEALPVIGDLANMPWEPINPEFYLTWAPFFAVVRTACLGLAIRSASNQDETPN